jgi:hypothetical protein
MAAVDEQPAGFGALIGPAEDAGQRREQRRLT